MSQKYKKGDNITDGCYRLGETPYYWIVIDYDEEYYHLKPPFSRGLQFLRKNYVDYKTRIVSKGELVLVCPKQSTNTPL